MHGSEAAAAGPPRRRVRRGWHAACSRGSGMHAAIDLSARMSSIATILERSPADALSLAEALERDLLAGPSTDPQAFGWARDYRIRALYRLGRHAEGLAVLTTPPPRVMTISARNAAWLHSVGAEMALRSGAHEMVRVLMSRALGLRIAGGDAASCGLAVETGFALLRQCGRPAELDAWLSHVEAQIAAAPDHAIATAMAEALATVARAPWFPGELPSAGRRRAEMALHRAAADGRLEEVRRRLAEGADVDARHPAWPGLPTPLLAASFLGHAAVVELLLSRGADVCARNVQGRTALHHAADQDHALVAAMLAQAGAPLDAVDLHRHTPLHVAAWQDHREAVRVLLGSGADLEARDESGDTPLALAASEPAPEIVRMLLCAGADVEATNHYGQTPLIRAASEGQAATAAALLEAGAKVDHRDDRQRTALDWARTEGHREVVKLLRRFAAPRH